LIRDGQKQALRSKVTHVMVKNGDIIRLEMSGGFWREAVIRDTWMSAKCPSRRFYDVLVASAFPPIPMLVKTISSSEGLLNARKPRKRDGGIVANKFNKKARRCRAFNLPEFSDSAWDSFGSCDDAEAVVVVLCHIVDQIDLPG
jgi:hypothetical protein